jgi:ribosomal protein S27AE
MRTVRKGLREEKKEDNRYLSCPRCGGVVLYQRRNGHRCFRRHLMELEMNIMRMGRAERV